MSKQRIYRFLIYSMGLLGVGFWIYAGNLANSFILNPREPNMGTGQIIPFVPKTSTVYITESDIRNYHFFLYGSFVLIGLYALLFFYFRKKDPEGFPESKLRASPGPLQRKTLIIVAAVFVILAIYSYFGR